MEKLFKNNATAVIEDGETKRRKYVRITEDIKISVMLDSDDGYSVPEIAKRNNICEPSVRKIIKELGIGNHTSSIKNKDTKTKQQKKEVKKTASKPTTTSKPKSIFPDYAVHDADSLIKFVESHCDEIVTSKDVGKLEVSMVADRHFMPIDTYIFTKSLDSELICDYDEQEKIVEQYIKSNISFQNGIPDKDLVVYATGIQSVLAAIIKTCLKLKVNLDIKHYYYKENGKDEYLTQTVFDNFVSLAKNNKYKIGEAKCLNSLYADNKLYFYGCKENDFVNMKDKEKFYVISFNDISDIKDGDKKLKGSSHIMCKTYQDVISAYAIMFPAIRNIKDKRYVLLAAEAEYVEETDNYKFITNIAMCYND